MRFDVKSVIEDEVAARSSSLDWLIAWGKIPSISGDPAFKDEVRRGAEFLRDELGRIGLENARVIDTAGHPITYAEFGHYSDKDTLLFYGHGDVQPTGELGKWTHGGPFEPTIVGSNIFFRGAMDDKGQVWIFLRAIAAILRVTGTLPFNLRMVIEHEEEVGSGNFYAFLESDEGKRLLAGTSSILVCDTDMPKQGQPALVWALRGMVYMEVTVSGPSHELHSGHGGGRVQNPIQALAYMLCQCRDETTGRILIPGFYDRVRAPSDAERALLASDPTTAEQLIEEFGVPQLWLEPGVGHNEATGFRPTFEVNGIWGGYTGEGAKTVIPPTAHAKISCRLVRDQDPAEIERLVSDHLRKVAPPTVRVDVQHLHSGGWVEVDPDSATVRRADAALRNSFGCPVAMMRSGGSIPVVGPMQKSFNAFAALMGFGLPDGNIHAPNENLHLPTADSGTESVIRFAAQF